MSAVRIFVPLDAAARSMGADDTARAILAEAQRRKIEVQIVRNGSRGLLWLEPLVEVEAAGRRYAYGPVSPEEVAGIVRGRVCLGLPRGRTPPLGARADRGDPLPEAAGAIDLCAGRNHGSRSVSDYLAHGGYRGLAAALAMQPAEIVEQRHRLGTTGPRGRGISRRHQMEDGAGCSRGHRSTSCAMPMREIRAHSRTAC